MDFDQMSDTEIPSVRSLVQLREQLTALDRERAVSIPEMVARWNDYHRSLQLAFERNRDSIQALVQSVEAPLRAFAEQQVRTRQAIELLTKPLAETLATRIVFELPALRALEVNIRGFHEQFAAHRQLIDTLQLRASVASVLEGISLRGYSALLVEGGRVLDRASDQGRSDELEVAANEVLLAGSVAAMSTGEAVEAVEVRVVQVIATTEQMLERELPRLRDGLLKKWRGARDAFAMRNPDRAAQVVYSLRELVKGAVNTMVAREGGAFEQWRATTPGATLSLEWKSRFLLRGTLMENGFAETDARWVKALLENMNTQGVHADAAAYTDAELLAIMRRVEGYLASLLELNRRHQG